MWASYWGAARAATVCGQSLWSLRERAAARTRPEGHPPDRPVFWSGIAGIASQLSSSGLSHACPVEVSAKRRNSLIWPLDFGTDDDLDAKSRPAAACSFFHFICHTHRHGRAGGHPRACPITRLLGSLSRCRGTWIPQPAPRLPRRAWMAACAAMTGWGGEARSMPEALELNRTGVGQARG